jgi:hypothetical protein
MSTKAPNSGAFSPIQEGRPTTFRPFKSTSTQNSDWLGPSIHAASILKEIADLVPIPYIRGVFGTVLILLETVEVWCDILMKQMTDLLLQRIKKNWDSLKELCESTMRIAVFIGDQLASHKETSAMILKNLCEKLEK